MFAEFLKTPENDTPTVPSRVDVPDRPLLGFRRGSIDMYAPVSEVCPLPPLSLIQPICRNERLFFAWAFAISVH
jgi:hypothetical protein